MFPKHLIGVRFSSGLLNKINVFIFICSILLELIYCLSERYVFRLWSYVVRYIFPSNSNFSENIEPTIERFVFISPSRYSLGILSLCLKALTIEFSMLIFFVSEPSLLNRSSKLSIRFLHSSLISRYSSSSIISNKKASAYLCKLEKQTGEMV